MRTVPPVLPLAVATLGGLACSSLAQPSAYTILDLGSLAGNTGSAAAFALNDDAFITGWSTAPATTTLAASRRAFLYNPLAAGPLAMRDPLIGVPGTAEGTAINNANLVAGTIWQANQGGPRGFIVGGPTAVASQVRYIDPLSGGNATTAADMNDAGQVVGSSNLATTSLASRPTHAILWQNGQTLDLGTLGGRNSQATAISEAGVIVGVSDLPALGLTAPPTRRGFIHPGPGHSMTALSALTNSGGSRANDVSDTAIIVGASDWISLTATPLSPPPIRAVLWTPATTTILNLGTLRNTDRSSEALAVNDAGQVVGWSGTPSNAIAPSTGPTGPTAGSATRAFIWEEGTMYDLNLLIPAGSGWILHVASDINEQGQIVGWGTRLSATAAAPRQVRAFLLTPMPTDADR